jgi:hypothetical protein
VHFEKSSEGVQAAILAVLTETGDESVTLVCEASKNFLKNHPSVVLPGGTGKGKWAPKEMKMSANFEYKRTVPRSLSFHDAPVPDHRDINLPKRPPSRDTFPGPDRDNFDGNYPHDVYFRRKGPSFSKQEPFHPQYMQESSNYNKEFYIMQNPEDVYYTAQNSEDMQGDLSNQAYIPVQNHYQNPYYDVRFRQHSMALVPVMKEVRELDPASSPLGPFPIPIIPREMQKYQYIPSFDTLPAPQRRLSRERFVDVQLSDFGEEVYSPTSTYPPAYVESFSPYPYTYSDSLQPQPSVQYMYPISNNGYNSYQRSFNYNQIEGSYQQPYAYAMSKPQVAPIVMK